MTQSQIQSVRPQTGTWAASRKASGRRVITANPKDLAAQSRMPEQDADNTRKLKNSFGKSGTGKLFLTSKDIAYTGRTIMSLRRMISSHNFHLFRTCRLLYCSISGRVDCKLL